MDLVVETVTTQRNPMIIFIALLAYLVISEALDLRKTSLELNDLKLQATHRANKA